VKNFSRYAAAAAVSAAALAAGCGYALVGRGSNLPADVKSVYLKPFDNQTARSQVEQILTRALADELVTRHRFSMVGDATQADAELSGAVQSFAVTPVTFDSQGRATEYEISIVAKVSFKRTGSDAILWSNDRYLFRENYPVEVSESGYFDRETLAIEQVAGKFAETMVSDLLEGF
jgi:outer membrane lipopolysaccharide assembly protein LptE/RlpB